MYTSIIHWLDKVLEGETDPEHSSNGVHINAKNLDLR